MVKKKINLPKSSPKEWNLYEPFLEEHIFKILRSHFKERLPPTNGIESFDRLVNFELQKIIDNTPTLDIPIPLSKNRYQATFGQVYVSFPQIMDENRKYRPLYPSECRLRDLTYDAMVYVDISENLLEETEKGLKVLSSEYYSRVQLTKLPIMLNSCRCNLRKESREKKIKLGECENDHGGYFIIRGKERVLVAQERVNYNIAYSFPSKDKKSVEMRSMSDETGHSVLIECYFDSQDNIVFDIPHIKHPVLAGLLLKSLFFTEEMINDIFGEIEWINDEKIYDYSTIIRRLLRVFRLAPDSEEARTIIGSMSVHMISNEKYLSYAEQILDNEIFPHMGVCSNFRKGYLICQMIRKLILTKLEIRNQDHRDNISMKRIEVAGILIEDLFRILFKRVLDKVKKQLSKRQDIITLFTKDNNIGSSIHSNFSTGNWGIQKNNYVKKGVSQVLNRISYIASQSHLMRSNIPIGKKGKNVEIRQIHPSQFFFFCPSETPEGPSVGILKNMSLSARTTCGIPTFTILDILEYFPEIIDIDDIQLPLNNASFILVNGYLYGYTKDPYIFIKKFKEERKNKFIHQDVSISYSKIDREIKIFSDAGRMCRPLITNFNLNPDLSWGQLVSSGHIQYFDSQEIENSLVSMYPNDKNKNRGTLDNEWIGSEIHPIFMLGICAGCIPFSDHTQSPRNTYQASMSKQAIGVYSLAYSLRTDTLSHLLRYVQKPLVKTIIEDCLNISEMGEGQNCIVAISTYTHYDQEDSAIINQSAIDRGMFVSDAYKTVCIEERKKTSHSYDTIEIPSEEVKVKSFNYNKLNREGIIREGLPLSRGDVLVARTTTKVYKDKKNEVIDTSLVIKSEEDGIIDKVFITTNLSGNKMIKIRIRITRIFEPGDKSASREGQKGTCGIIYRQEDMPFTESGIVPDVIINPHCIPSRMTINQLIECVLGKASALNGTYGDSTPFTKFSQNNYIREEIGEKLVKNGFEFHGNEAMYSGITGKMMQTSVFIGPTFYQKLKHMVSEKMHARAFGNVQVLSRQPAEGRARDGGLRLGMCICPKVMIIIISTKIYYF